jgi:hypothetical protein
MSRMFLVWSLLFGLVLAGADWWVEREHAAPEAVPSYEGGTPINAPAAPDEGQAKMMEGGTPMPPK